MIEGRQISEIVHLFDSFEIDEFVVTFVHVQVSSVSFFVREIRQILRLVVCVRLANLDNYENGQKEKLETRPTLRQGLLLIECVINGQTDPRGLV